MGHGPAPPDRSALAVAVVIAATALGLGLRLLQLSRPGFLDGVTEYDDGVYFGATVRLLEGWLPYRDIVFVQPSGILVLMAPLAGLARLTSTATGLALARIATTLVSAATVPAVARVLRREGALALLVGCGVLAVSSAGMNAAHTLLLEPWSAFLAALGFLAVFVEGTPTRQGRRLIAGGFALGLASAVKLWALVPAAVVAVGCLTTLPWRAAARYLAGAALAFAVTVLPFALLAPRAFLRDVVVAQFVRTDAARVPLLERLENLTGLGAFGPTVASGVVVAACVVGLLVALGAPALAWSLTRRRPTPLHLCSVATLVVLLAGFLVPADYFPHYGWFFAPFLALSLALGVGSTAWRGVRLPRALPVALAALVLAGIVVTAEVEGRNLASLHGNAPGAIADREIPAGACVATDLVSLTIVSDRFDARRPGCSVMVDGLGTDLALSHGRIATNGAGRTLAVRAAWLGAFRRADYVWLQCRPTAPGCMSARRIPWTAGLRALLRADFRPVRGPLPALWVRRVARRTG